MICAAAGLEPHPAQHKYVEEVHEAEDEQHYTEFAAFNLYDFAGVGEGVGGLSAMAM